MSTQLSPQPTENSNTRNTVIAGVFLIVIGLLAFTAQLIDLDNYGMAIPFLLGVIFLAWGLLTRTFGLLIPGGILTGIGVGVILTEQSLFPISEAHTDVAFLLAFAGGWALITLLSPLTKDRLQWWPLIPGGILGAIGLLLLGGDAGLQVLEFIRLAWPLGLLAAGAYLIYRYRKA